MLVVVSASHALRLVPLFQLLKELHFLVLLVELIQKRPLFSLCHQQLLVLLSDVKLGATGVGKFAIEVHRGSHGFAVLDLTLQSSHKSNLGPSTSTGSTVVTHLRSYVLVMGHFYLAKYFLIHYIIYNHT